MRFTNWAVLTLAVLGAACSGDSGDIGGPSSPIEPPPPPPATTPEPPPPGPPPGPAPVGYGVYAVDLANRLLYFGTESPGVLSKIRKITGLPLLKRIVGIDFRPSNGRLYGVGNDSRVYVIDTATAVATPVSTTPFEPRIASFFDVHFGMGIDPRTERIRLIATESGGNWSIDLDNGTATLGKTARYGSGPHAGRRVQIIGLDYRPTKPGAVGEQALRAALSTMGPCEDLMYAINAEYAEIIGSCDPDEGDFTSLGPIPGVTSIAGCGEFKFDHGPGNLWKVIQDGASDLNKMGYIDENGIPHWTGNVNSESPIQAMAFEPGGKYGPQQARASTGLRQAGPAASTVAIASSSRSSSSGLAPLSGDLSAEHREESTEQGARKAEGWRANDVLFALHPSAFYAFTRLRPYAFYGVTCPSSWRSPRTRLPPAAA